MRSGVRVGLGLSLILGSWGCSSEQESSGTTIYMAGAFSRTGVSAVSTWSDALRLAADDASQGLELAGYPTQQRLRFDTLFADTRNDTAITTERAIEMVQVQGAKMVMNGTSADTVALAKLAYDTDPANDLNVPIICVACSSPAMHNPNSTNADAAVQAANRNGDRWIFGLAMSSLPQAKVLWNILVDNTPQGGVPGDLNGDNVVKISTVALDDAFGIGFQDAMEQVVRDASTSAVYEKTKHAKDADLNQYDWAGAVELLTDGYTGDTADGPPDVVIEFTFPQFSLALVKAYSSGIPFMHTHSMRERTVILSAEGRLDGQEGTSYLPSDGESGRMFDERFREVVEISRQSQWDSDIYDGAFLFALGTLAAAKGLTDPATVTGAQIRDAMIQLNDPNGEVIRIGPEEFAKGARAIAEGRAINYEGASGPVDFDDYGRAKNRISHWRVEGGEVSDVAVYDCIAGEACPKM
jgi:hypothetical protein